MFKRTNLSPKGFTDSVREIEVVISIVVVLSLSKAGANEVEGAGHEGHSQPDLAAVVHHVSLDEELSSSTVHEVEEPLLGGVGAMMPDVASCVRRLCVPVLLAIPSSPLLLGHAETFTESKSHILLVSQLVMLKSTS